jgi:hypothetical protein
MMQHNVFRQSNTGTQKIPCKKNASFSGSQDAACSDPQSLPQTPAEKSFQIIRSNEQGVGFQAMVERQITNFVSV